MQTDEWFEIPGLAEAARRLVPDAIVKATYTAGPMYQEEAGSPAVLWIGVSNSSLNDRGAEAMAPVADGILPLAVAWLHEEHRAIADTLIDITFADSSEFGPFSWSNTLESFRFSIGVDGQAAPIVSRHSPEAAARARKLRYRFSGRRPSE